MKVFEECDTVCANRYRCAWSSANEDMKNPIVFCPEVRDQKGLFLAPYKDIGKWRKRLGEG